MVKHLHADPAHLTYPNFNACKFTYEAPGENPNSPGNTPPTELPEHSSPAPSTEKAISASIDSGGT